MTDTTLALGARPLDRTPTSEAAALTASAPPQSPGRMFWNQFRKSQVAVIGGGLLILFYGLALFAPFVAPYPEDLMDRDRFFHPPMRLHWVDARGTFHAWPFVRSKSPRPSHRPSQTSWCRGWRTIA